MSDKRASLIALAIKYEGEYMKIVEALKKQEQVEPIEVPNAITIFDDDYPKSLLELKYPPLVLFYKGNINLLKDENIKAIVGSRRPCDYSVEATKKIIDKEPDRTYISGLALGIDAVAHEHSAKSIGVIGCGIDYIYPAQNNSLYNKLEKNGLIISEYPGTVKPLAYHFTFRNRIIAALAKEVNIIELQQKSGTMTTVNEALELGKGLKVLPFPFGSNSYNNELINEGAEVIL